MIELEEEFSEARGKILVAGVGKAGCVVAEKLLDWSHWLDLVAIDTDADTLRKVKVPSKVQIGSHLTKGFGTAENPETARKAALDERGRLSGLMGKPDIAFVTAGLGKGAGTGALPPVVEIASALGAVTVVVVTTPFEFEGKKRVELAASCLKEISRSSDTLIVIPNEEISSEFSDQTLLTETYDQATEMILELIKNVSEIIMNPGVFRVDVPELKKLLGKSGNACFGVGFGEGEDRLNAALEAALRSPLAKKVKPSRAKTVLMHIKGGKDLTQEEVQKISATLASKTGRTDGIIGVDFDRKLGNKAKIWLLLAGIEAKEEGPRPGSQPAAPAKAAEEPHPYDFAHEPAEEGDLDVPALIRKQRGVRHGL